MAGCGSPGGRGGRGGGGGNDESGIALGSIWEKFSGYLGFYKEGITRGIIRESRSIKGCRRKVIICAWDIVGHYIGRILSRDQSIIHSPIHLSIFYHGCNTIQYDRIHQ